MIDRVVEERNFSSPSMHPSGLAWDGEFLWHSDGDTNRIYCLNSQTGEILREFDCDDVRRDLAYDGACLWSLGGRPMRIRVINPKSGVLEREIILGKNAEKACGLFATDQEYWVGYKEIALIERRSRVENDVIAQYHVLSQANGLAIVESTLWYTCYDQSLLVGIDVQSGEGKKRFHLSGRPTGLCHDGDLFWYCDYASKRLCAVRAANNSPK